MKQGMTGFVVPRLLAIGILVLGLNACSKVNDDYCRAASECETGQACTGNLCVDVGIGEPDANQTDATPIMYDAGPNDPDATPVCPAATHQCLPEAPTGWTGPTARAEIGVDDPVPACATEAGGLAAGAGFEAAVGSCSCSCGTVQNINCTPARVESIEAPAAIVCASANCLGAGCEPFVNVPQDTCVPWAPVFANSDNYLRTVPGKFVAGTCAVGQLTENIPNESFDEKIGLCAVEQVVGDCGVSAFCAPARQTGFLEESCIYQAGIHDCPTDSVFSEQTITYASLTDTRSCDSCDCNLPALNTSCASALTGHPYQPSGLECTVLGYASSDLCNLKSNYSITSGSFKYSPTADCSPTQTTPALLGEVTGVNPVTVCCQPAL